MEEDVIMVMYPETSEAVENTPIVQSICANIELSVFKPNNAIADEETTAWFGPAAKSRAPRAPSLFWENYVFLSVGVKRRFWKRRLMRKGEKPFDEDGKMRHEELERAVEVQMEIGKGAKATANGLTRTI